jgi:hypothetical protein
MMPVQLSSLVPGWATASYPCIVCGKMTPPDEYWTFTPSKNICCCKNDICKDVHNVESLLKQITDVHHRFSDPFFSHWFSSCSLWISDDSGWTSCLLTPGVLAPCSLLNVLPFISKRYRFQSPSSLSWSFCDNDTRLYISGRSSYVFDMYSYLEEFLDFSIKISDRFRLSPEFAGASCLSQPEE